MCTKYIELHVFCKSSAKYNNPVKTAWRSVAAGVRAAYDKGDEIVIISLVHIQIYKYTLTKGGEEVHV